MSSEKFHLAWFLNFVADDWAGTWGPGGDSWAGDFYIEIAKDLERVGFDFVILEDKLMVSDAYGGTMEHDLKQGIAPKHDPVPLATLMAYETSRLGVIPTMSTSFYPPFLLARLTATIDHIARGRFGLEHRDLGRGPRRPELRPRQALRARPPLRHGRRVPRSWSPRCGSRGSPTPSCATARTGVYVDHTKVHRVDFEGQFYRSRGPLNTVPPQGGRPVLCQAGASPKGRAFAAKYADTIIAMGTNVADMKAYREDIRDRLIGHGRKPDDCKVLFLVSPMVDETVELAHAKARRWIEDPLYIEWVLTEISSITEVDFSQFDLDEPLPEDLTTNGERGTLEAFMQRGSGKTLRELIGLGLVDTIELIGTPDTVADRMGEIMDEVGGDGFLLTCPSGRLNRRYVAEITDGLVPALQRRGLTRTGYTYEHFRDNLLEF